MKICFEKGAPGTSDAEYVERYKGKSKTDERGCWLLQTFLHPKTGYGDLCYRGKNMRAHRAMYIAAKGPIPEGLHVLHTCDVRHCVNPDHLWLGTISDNKQDELQKGRNWEASKTECPRGHLYAENTVRHGKRQWRQCRICLQERYARDRASGASRERQRRRRERMKESRLSASLGMRRSGE
jgi:HNH endonuclease